MLLNQLNQVTEIDNLITEIQDELSQLYQERSSLLNGTGVKQQSLPQLVKTKQADWVAEQYRNLAAVWAQYSIAIPSLTSLKPRLNKAYKTIKALEAAKPDWIDWLRVILVPPTNKFSFPVAAELRMSQSFVTSADSLDASLPTVKKDAVWRVLVVYAADEGLYSGSLEMMLKQDNKVAGYDTTALGVREYAAFSMHLIQPVDTQSWSILPKGQTKAEQVPCVAFVDGQFRFDSDEVNSVFGDNRFRPAVEVKA